MKKILAFAGSNSSRSINQKLIEFASSLLTKTEVNIINLADYEVELYHADRERENGVPKKINQLNTLFNECDAFMIGLPEYNSSVTPFFKNTIDWISRVEAPIFKDKQVLLLATSGGKRGAQSVLKYVGDMLQWWGGKTFGAFSLPSFNENFDGKVSDEAKLTELKDLVQRFEESLH